MKQSPAAAVRHAISNTLIWLRVTALKRNTCRLRRKTAQSGIRPWRLKLHADDDRILLTAMFRTLRPTVDRRLEAYASHTALRVSGFCCLQVPIGIGGARRKLDVDGRFLQNLDICELDLK